MPNAITLQTLHCTIQSALRGQKLSEGAQLRAAQIGCFRQFCNWLLNLLSNGELETRIGEQIAEDKEAIRTQGFGTVRSLLNIPVDERGDLAEECIFQFEHQSILLRQEQASLVLIDYDDPKNRTVLTNITIQQLKTRVFVAWLKETGARLQKFDGLLDFSDIDFTGHLLDTADLIVVLNNHGDPTGATLSEPVNSSTVDLKALRMNRHMALHLLRLHEQPREVLIEYLNSQRLQGKVPVDLSGFDLTKVDLSGLNLKDIRLIGAQFGDNLLRAVLDEETRRTFRSCWDDRFITRVQDPVSPHAPLRKKNSGADFLTAITGPEGNSLRYQFPDKRRTLGFRLVKMPPAIRNGVQGCCKRLTHSDQNSDGYVALTVLEGIDHDVVKGADQSEIVKLIEEQNLSTLIVQYRINKNQYLMENMGGEDLKAQLRKGKYSYPIDQILLQFTPLAEDLQVLHDNQIVHRDIKPENVILKNGSMHLIDPDFIEKVVRITGPKGSFRYMHINLPIKYKEFAIKIDQHAFFLTVMSAFYKDQPSFTGRFSKTEVHKFTNLLPCPGTWRDELSSFIQNPAETSLTHPLQAYLRPMPI